MSEIQKIRNLEGERRMIEYLTIIEIKMERNRACQWMIRFNREVDIETNIYETQMA